MESRTILHFELIENAGCPVSGSMAVDSKEIENVDSWPSTVDGEEAVQAETDEPKRARNRKLYYAAGVSVGIVLLAGIVWWIYSRQFEKTDDAFLDGNISVVTTKIGAHVYKIHVAENQFVKKGDLLIEFDAREAEASLEDKKAALQTALAKKNRATANYNLISKTSNADLNQASSGLSSSKNSYEQTRILSDSKLNSIEHAKNRLKTAEATLNEAEAQIPEAEAKLEQAKAQIPASQTRLETAETNYERSKQLFESGDISKREHEVGSRELSDARAEQISRQKQADINQAQVNQLRRRVDAERSRVEEAKNVVVEAENAYRQSLSQVDIASDEVNESRAKMMGANTSTEQKAIGESEIGTADAEIAQAEASLKQAELNLSYAKIVAPQDGYVSKKSVVEGQLVQPDQTLMSISLPGMWVTANFKETQIERMKVGQPVDIYVDAYPNTTFKGKIDSFQIGTDSRFSIFPAENASGNFVKVVQRVSVKIVFEQPPDERYLLVPGMSVIPRVKV